MNTKTIGFVGGGRIAKILLGGWSRAGCLPGDVLVSDPDSATLERLKRQFPTIVTVAGDNAAAASRDVVVLGVHPPLLAEVLDGIGASLRQDSVLVSLAPKFTTGKLSGLLDGFDRIVRVIPNAPSLVGCGYNPICFASGIPVSERPAIRSLLEPLGHCPVVDEKKLEAYAILTAMGPTYFWPQFLELLALSEQFGLSPEEAREGLATMINGAVTTLIKSGSSATEILDLIPVKPLDKVQPQLQQAYREALSATFAKIQP